MHYRYIVRQSMCFANICSSAKKPLVNLSGDFKRRSKTLRPARGIKYHHVYYRDTYSMDKRKGNATRQNGRRDSPEHLSMALWISSSYPRSFLSHAEKFHSYSYVPDSNAYYVCQRCNAVLIVVPRMEREKLKMDREKESEEKRCEETDVDASIIKKGKSERQPLSARIRPVKRCTLFFSWKKAKCSTYKLSWYGIYKMVD